MGRKSLHTLGNDDTADSGSETHRSAPCVTHRVPGLHEKVDEGGFAAATGVIPLERLPEPGSFGNFGGSWRVQIFSQRATVCRTLRPTSTPPGP